MLWHKFKNVFYAVVYLRKLVQKKHNDTGSAQGSSDIKSNSSSTTSVEKTREHDDTWTSTLDQFRDLAAPLQAESQPLGEVAMFCLWLSKTRVTSNIETVSRGFCYDGTCFLA